MNPENNQPQPNDSTDVEVHQAGTVITPSGGTTPPTPQPPAPTPTAAPAPDLAPTATPAPAPAPNPPTVSTAPAAPQPSIQPLTQADFLAIAKKDKRPKRLAILIGTPIAIILLLAVLHSTGIFPLTAFKTVKYDNGQDSTYSLSFYSRHKVEDASKDEEDLSGASKVLVSKKGKAGQSPLKLYIQDTEAGNSSSGFSNSLKSCGRQAKSVFTAYNKASQADVSVCDFGSIVGVDDALYMAAFEQNDHLIAVLITSEALDDTKNLSDTAEAKKVLEKAKLDVYEDDIKKIIGSIELVSD